MADMLRRRPWDFGAVGDPLVPGADAVLSRADGGIEMSGVECIKGFQRLVVLAHVMREVSGVHLDHANVRVEIVMGAARARIRRLSEEAGDYVNLTHPQDRLSRCPHLKRIAGEFRTEGEFFDHRRALSPGAAAPGDVAGRPWCT
ncbi:hypothetical protein ACFU99_00060 [Streptomyces sp. NPDC057654]|uniref:hypothetical protein n=1 Tax=Streptomyces sp. NPDC057654 TaxID=3346196 RepID=UPI0036C56072